MTVGTSFPHLEGTEEIVATLFSSLSIHPLLAHGHMEKDKNQSRQEAEPQQCKNTFKYGMQVKEAECRAKLLEILSISCKVLIKGYIKLSIKQK